MEAMVIESLTVGIYHAICYWDLGQTRHISVSVPKTVTLGAVIHNSSDDRLEELVELDPSSDIEVSFSDWLVRGVEEGEGLIMPDGWTRYYDYLSSSR
jgi:hypothetical protein